MNRIGLGLAAVCVSAAPAFSQYVVVEPTPRAVYVAPEVREYVIREAPSVRYEYDYDGPVTIGRVLPDEIRIFDVNAPGFEDDYGYTVVDDRRVIIEPETRRIIEVLD